MPRPEMGGLETYKTIDGTRADRIDQENCDVQEKDCEDEGQHCSGDWQDRDEALNATAQAKGAWKIVRAAQSAD